MGESSINNVGNQKMELMLKEKGVFFTSLYGKTWDDLIANAKIQKFSMIFLIKSVKDNITKIVPEATGVSREVDNAFNALQRNGIENPRNTFVNKAVEVTINIIARYVSLEELENRLANYE